MEADPLRRAGQPLLAAQAQWPADVVDGHGGDGAKDAEAQDVVEA